MAINPVTNKVYVANGDGQVMVIHIDTNTTKTVTVGASIYHVAVNPATNRIYVARCCGATGTHTVVVIDGATDTVIANVKVGMAPRALAVNPVTNKI